MIEFNGENNTHFTLSFTEKGEAPKTQLNNDEGVTQYLV